MRVLREVRYVKFESNVGPYVAYSVCRSYVIRRSDRELRFDVDDSRCLHYNRNRYRRHRVNRNRSGHSYRVWFVERAVVNSFIGSGAIVFIVVIVLDIFRSFV